MGLDWLPGNKSKPGHEDEYLQIVAALEEDRRPRSWKEIFGNLFSGKAIKKIDEEALKARFHEISIVAYESLDAPRVGYDDAATEWARKTRAEHRPEIPEKDWLEDYHGFYVFELAPKCDGLPLYSNAPMGYVEAYSFRGQFLKDCQDIIGKDLFARAYKRQLAPEMIAYGKELIARAKAWAVEHGVDLDSIDPEAEDFDLDSPEGKVDIVMSAGRWCVFWGERGHLLDPDF